MSKKVWNYFTTELDKVLHHSKEYTAKVIYSTYWALKINISNMYMWSTTHNKLSTFRAVLFLE